MKIPLIDSIIRTKCFYFYNFNKMSYSTKPDFLFIFLTNRIKILSTIILIICANLQNRNKNIENNLYNMS